MLLLVFSLSFILAHGLNSILSHNIHHVLERKIGVCYAQEEGSMTLTCQKLCHDECHKQVVASHYINRDCSGESHHIDTSTYASHPYNCDHDPLMRRVLASTSTPLCSALKASVQLQGKTTTEQGNTSTSNTTVWTLLSAQALFPPHTFHVDWSDVVYLSNTEDICDVTTPLSTNISTKVVLLYEAIGSCSVHYKVLRAEANGALGVLMSNDDYSGMVVNIPDDDTLSTAPTIPMRSISKTDAEALHEDIEVGTYDTLQAFIGCFNDNYASVLCVTETRVDVSHKVRGEFQLQMNATHNGHPVWQLEEYTFWTRPLYLFLHDAKGNSDWLWVMSWDRKMLDDSLVYLRCSTGKQGNTTIDDPILCPSWLSTDGMYTPDMNITSDVCPIVSDQNTSTVCIQSQSDLAGIRGTYSLVMSDRVEWARELSDCDAKSGLLSYAMNGGTFTLHVDTRHTAPKATCSLDESVLTAYGGAEHVAYRPDLCTLWKVRGDTHYLYSTDDSFTVTIGACDDAISCVVSDAPDALCVANNTLVLGSLMGEFVKMDTIGPHFHTPMYKREPPADAPWLSNTVYLWYANEYFASKSTSSIYKIHYTRYWVLSPYTLNQTLDTASITDDYGHCYGYASGNPVHCLNWVFNAEGAVPLWNEPITVNEGACGNDFWPQIPDTWPSYVCLGLKDEALNTVDTDGESLLPASALIGGYEWEVATDYSPIWAKPNNDAMDETLFLWYNDDATVWEIGTRDFVHNDEGKIMVCDPFSGSSSTLNPVDCLRWVDAQSNALDNMYLFECSAADVVTASPSSAPVAVALPSLCLSHDYGSLSSFLCGVYNGSAYLADDYDTIEFVKRDAEKGDLFLWYDESKWVLSSVEFESASSGDVYGYCTGGEASTLVPVCTDCWRFWLSPNCEGDCPYVEDCSFTMTSDASACEEGVVLYPRDPQFGDMLCVDGEVYRLEGADSLTAAYSGDNLDMIYYDSMSNNWWFASPNVYCDSGQTEGSNVLIPVDCVTWNEESQTTELVQDWKVAEVTQSAQCNDKNKGGEGGNVAAIVIGIVFAAILILIVVVVVMKRRANATKQHTHVEEREMIGDKQDDNTLRDAPSSPQKLATFDDDLCAPDVDDDDDEEEDHGDQDEDPLNEP